MTAAIWLIAAGVILWVIFIAVNVSVAFEVADQRNRSAVAWGLFSFLFPVAGPVLVWLLPPRQ